MTNKINHNNPLLSIVICPVIFNYIEINTTALVGISTNKDNYLYCYRILYNITSLENLLQPNRAGHEINKMFIFKGSIRFFGGTTILNAAALYYNLYRCIEDMQSQAHLKKKLQSVRTSYILNTF